jgi:ribonuclease, Rne/Rng family
MKRILINATQREELRVAIVDGQRLVDLDLELAGREQRKSNIYRGRVTRAEASLEACFVDYGAERHGFLPLKEISPEYLKGEPGGGRNIRNLISEGTELIVQVEKEERGTKGAALTTFISLAGRYLVLMPNNPRAGGISRRVEGEEREEAREAMRQLQLPDGMGTIIRTNGMGRSAEELQWDLDHLATIWKTIVEAAAERPAPFLIYQENNIVLRALRDYLRPDIGEVIVDNAEVYESAREQMAHSMPGELAKLKLYADSIPLFSRYQIESQIEAAHERQMRLPSGGSIVIDHTEALTAIDINSARATSGGGIEETALQTNLEAADEIARQLRLRDLGGLVVVDFIDMSSNRNQREVEKRLTDACTIDRARVQIGRLSRFGLLEMSRQRLRPSLGEHTQIPCPRCSGRGQIRSIESMSLSVLRLVEEECMKDRTGRVIAQLPVEAAAYLLNEKRAAVAEIEGRYNVVITLVPNETLQSPHFDIQRLRVDQQDSDTGLSYALRQDFNAESRARMANTQTSGARPFDEPAVKPLLHDAPPPAPIDAPAAAQVQPAAMQAVPVRGFWARLLGWLGLGARDAASERTHAPRRNPPQGRREPGSTSSRQSEGSGTAHRRDTRGARPAGRASDDRRSASGNAPRRGERGRGTGANAGNRPARGNSDQTASRPRNSGGSSPGNGPNNNESPRRNERPRPAAAERGNAGDKPAAADAAASAGNNGESRGPQRNRGDRRPAADHKPAAAQTGDTQEDVIDQSAAAEAGAGSPAAETTNDAGSNTGGPSRRRRGRRGRGRGRSAQRQQDDQASADDGDASPDSPAVESSGESAGEGGPQEPRRGAQSRKPPRPWRDTDQRQHGLGRRVGRNDRQQQAARRVR